MSLVINWMGRDAAASNAATTPCNRHNSQFLDGSPKNRGCPIKKFISKDTTRGSSLEHTPKQYIDGQLTAINRKAMSCQTTQALRPWQYAILSLPGSQNLCQTMIVHGSVLSSRLCMQCLWCSSESMWHLIPIIMIMILVYHVNHTDESISI